MEKVQKQLYADLWPAWWQHWRAPGTELRPGIRGAATPSSGREEHHTQFVRPAADLSLEQGNTTQDPVGGPQGKLPVHCGLRGYSSSTSSWLGVPQADPALELPLAHTPKQGTLRGFLPRNTVSPILTPQTISGMGQLASWRSV